MKTADYTRLVLLAAIWGASFIFMRVAAPAFGTVLTAEGRLLIAGLVLAAWFRYSGFDPQWRRHAKAYAAIGAIEASNLLALALLGNALGFVMYFRLINDVGATRALTVTYLMPLFAVLWGMLFLGESLPASSLAGGVLILAGTVLVTRG